MKMVEEERFCMSKRGKCKVLKKKHCVVSTALSCVQRDGIGRFASGSSEKGLGG